MQKGIRESEYLEEYLCDNHTLQLAIRDTFDKVEGMQRLLKKCKDLAKMTHQTSSSRLVEKQGNSFKLPHKRKNAKNIRCPSAEKVLNQI